MTGKLTLKVNFTKSCSLSCLAKFYIFGRCTGLISDTSAWDSVGIEKETFNTRLGHCFLSLGETLLKNLFPPRGIPEFCQTSRGKLQNSGRRRNAPRACPSQKQRWQNNESACLSPVWFYSWAQRHGLVNSWRCSWGFSLQHPTFLSSKIEEQRCSPKALPICVFTGFFILSPDLYN